VTVPVVAALGLVDDAGIFGSSGVRLAWQQLGKSAPGDGRTFRAAFGRSDETFRRLDCASRALVLAGEAAGLSSVVPAASGAATGLVFETTLGCLDADLRFAASMATGMCDGATFAYTLPSTGLGELALRHGLRGPTMCLTTQPGQGGIALREAALLLATGEVEIVVAGVVDVLTTPHAPFAAECKVLLAVLAARQLGLPSIAPWPGAEVQAYDALAAAARGH
jgi:hypothetical protein